MPNGVLLPLVGDQIINARLMGGDRKAGVEVEKGEEDGLYYEGGCVTESQPCQMERVLVEQWA